MPDRMSRLFAIALTVGLHPCCRACRAARCASSSSGRVASITKAPAADLNGVEVEKEQRQDAYYAADRAYPQAS
jgi:hypothetical protein